MRLQPFDLRRRLYIVFKGEEGLDYGGIARSDSLSSIICAYMHSSIYKSVTHESPAGAVYETFNQ